MRKYYIAALGIMAISSSSVFAGTMGESVEAFNWTGFYAGGSVGWTNIMDTSRSILFDTNLDGQFGDTVRTVTGANAFSPGFCSGAAFGALPGQGCRSNNDDSVDLAARIGYDWQTNNLVFGAVGEYIGYNAHNSVTAFSTTPAFYTMNYELKNAWSVRGRAGMAFGTDSSWLPYVTAGATWLKVDSNFSSSNTANAFVQNERSNTVAGFQGGLGLEHLFTRNISVGLEYLYSTVDDDYRVRATRGRAGVTNPFILVNSNGTNFARSEDKINYGSLRLTATWRI